jgi:two-component system response regulator FlrC
MTGSEILASDLLLDDGMVTEDIATAVVKKIPTEKLRESQHDSEDSSNISLKDYETQIILDALDKYPTKKEVAEKLDMSPRTLRYKIAKLKDAGVEIPGG